MEILVRDLERSLAFYTVSGFTLERRTADFAALRWESRWVFLAQDSDPPALEGRARANLRIHTAHLDRIWATVQELHVPVERPVGHRDYGLRDRTIRDPDGFELRLAAPLGAAVTLEGTEDQPNQTVLRRKIVNRLQKARERIGIFLDAMAQVPAHPNDLDRIGDDTRDQSATRQ